MFRDSSYFLAFTYRIDVLASEVRDIVGGRKDGEGGEVRDDIEAEFAGAYSEPYAPLPGWNNGLCILEKCAVA